MLYWKQVKKLENAGFCNRGIQERRKKDCGKRFPQGVAGNWKNCARHREFTKESEV